MGWDPGGGGEGGELGRGGGGKWSKGKTPWGVRWDDGEWAKSETEKRTNQTCACLCAKPARPPVRPQARVPH